jgi:hypothetical protein
MIHETIHDSIQLARKRPLPQSEMLAIAAAIKLVRPA